MALDPVCGMEVTGKTISSEYKGESFFFCAQGCKQKFDKKPKKYLKKKPSCCCG